jgi:hypothetical protein
LFGGAGGWRRTAERIAVDIEYLIDELCGEEDENENEHENKHP